MEIESKLKEKWQKNFYTKLVAKLELSNALTDFETEKSELKGKCPENFKAELTILISKNEIIEALRLVKSHMSECSSTEGSMMEAIDLIYSRIEEFFEKGAYHASLKFCERLLYLCPDHPDAQKLEAELQAILKQFDREVKKDESIFHDVKKRINSTSAATSDSIRTLEKYIEYYQKQKRIINEGVLSCIMVDFCKKLKSLRKERQFSVAITSADRLLRLFANHPQLLLEKAKAELDLTAAFNPDIFSPRKGLKELQRQVRYFVDKKQYVAAIELIKGYIQQRTEMYVGENEFLYTITCIICRAVEDLIIDKTADPKGTLQILDHLLQILPTHLRALLQKAELLISTQSYQPALKTINRILEYDRDNFSAVRLKALTLTYLGQYDESMKYCDQILRMDRYNLCGRLKASMLARRGQYHEALICINTLLEMNSKDPYLVREQLIYLKHDTGI